MRKILYTGEWDEIGASVFADILNQAVANGADKVELECGGDWTQIIITRPETEQEAATRINLQCIVDKVADEIFADMTVKTAQPR